MKGTSGAAYDGEFLCIKCTYLIFLSLHPRFNHWTIIESEREKQFSTETPTEHCELLNIQRSFMKLLYAELSKTKASLLLLSSLLPRSSRTRNSRWRMKKNGGWSFSTAHLVVASHKKAADEANFSELYCFAMFNREAAQQAQNSLELYGSSFPTRPHVLISHDECIKGIISCSLTHKKTEPERKLSPGAIKKVSHRSTQKEYWKQSRSCAWWMRKTVVVSKVGDT